MAENDPPVKVGSGAAMNELNTNRELHQVELHTGKAVTAQPKQTARIYRASKSDHQPYFLMSRKTAQDDNLSWAARGVLAYLLSKPDDWCVQAHDLQQKCGRDKVYSILDELIATGYITRDHIQDPVTKQFTGWDYYVHETPVNPDPSPAKPDMAPNPEKPDTAKPTLANPDSTEYREEVQNTDHTLPPPVPVATKPVKAKKSRPRDPVFDAIALGSFNMANVTNGSGGRIAKLVKGLHDCTPPEHGVTLADDLPKMYLWYKARYPNLSAPASVETICKYLSEWRQVAVTTPPKPAPGTYRLIDTDDWVAPGPAR